ncbi:MAG TPA: YccF domain-containing protein [Caulobacteraceae bacterium]|nr:YccF domain-containing protein [Caulobacteraceae bacterium]
MSLLLNILWFILGGWLTGLLWVLGGLLLAVTIVGLPWTMAAWRIAGFAFFPFGKQIVERRDITGRDDLGTGCLGAGLNVIWILLGAWHIALAHLVIGAAQAVTIIGIPFAWKNFQLAWIALMPVGKAVAPA